MFLKGKVIEVSWLIETVDLFAFLCFYLASNWWLHKLHVKIKSKPSCFYDFHRSLKQIMVFSGIKTISDREIMIHEFIEKETQFFCLCAWQFLLSFMLLFSEVELFCGWIIIALQHRSKGLQLNWPKTFWSDCAIFCCEMIKFRCC